MSFSRNKTEFTAAIVLILLMASVILMGNIPVKAATNEHYGSVPGSLPAGVTPDVTMDTMARMSFSPNPIGVGQSLLVNLWLTPPLPNPQYHTDYTVTITKPDGTTEVVKKNSFRADTTAWFNYAVDQVGTWTLKFDFLGSYFPAGNYSTVEGSWITPGWYSFPNSSYYKPSSCGPFELVVQKDMVYSWPAASLPSDYWTRPVSSELREWWPILGYWPSTGYKGGSGYGEYWPADTNAYMNNYDYHPFTLAPNTAHIVWRREGAVGGLIGTSMGQTSSSAGGGTPSLVYAGKAYQTVTKYIDGKSTSVFMCYDVRTGQIYWERYAEGLPAPTFITIHYGEPHESGSSHMVSRGVYLGVISGGRLIKYNPYTGTVYQNTSVSPFTSGTLYADPYFLSVQNIGNTTKPNYRLCNWSVMWDYGASGAMTNVRMVVHNNVSWPWSSIGTAEYGSMIAVQTEAITAQVSSVNPPTLNTRIIAANMLTGQVMWNVTADVGNYMISSGSTAVADQGKFAVRFEDGVFHAWDLYTGKHIWKQELSSFPWGVYGCYAICSYGGMILANQYDGCVALNWTNGKTVWFFQSKAPYAFETPYQDNYPFFSSSEVADGKLYIYTTEHTPTQPITRGWRMHCVNVTTGEGIWSITGAMSPGAIHDGYLFASCPYDGYTYVFGKGKSETTVTASPKTIAEEATVLIEGTVLDISPGDQGNWENPTQRLDATKTVPCVSADSMTTQMEYLYLQRPIDGLNHNITMTGVPVTLTAIDSNGNGIDIGTTTTNAYYGTFSKAWTPPNEGTYTIVASFAGDNSYGSSSAATALSVGPAPASPTPTPMPEAAPDNTPLMYGILVAVIIAIIIGLIALFRKR